MPSLSALRTGQVIVHLPDGRRYRYGGLDSSGGAVYEMESALYPGRWNRKSIPVAELEALWQRLHSGRVLTQDFRDIAPVAMRRGSCCVTAFFGIVNSLFPRSFARDRGVVLRT